MTSPPLNSGSTGDDEAGDEEDDNDEETEADEPEDTDDDNSADEDINELVADSIELVKLELSEDEASVAAGELSEPLELGWLETSEDVPDEIEEE